MIKQLTVLYMVSVTKVEGTVTDFDTVKTVSTTGDSVSADLDVTRATFALGYKF